MYDIYDDNGALLRNLYPSQDALPGFVVSADIPSRDFSKLAEDDFAVAIPGSSGIRQAYPIMNDGAAALSYLYFEHTHQNLPVELRKQAACNIAKACERFGVDIEAESKVAELSTDYHEMRTPATPLKKPLQSQGLGGSPLFPLSTLEQVKIASELFGSIIPKLSPEERVEFSGNLLEKCAEFGLDRPVEAYKWAGGEISRVLVLDAIEKRAQFMSPEQLLLLREASDDILDLQPEKVAELFEEMDVRMGLDSMYDRGVPDPQAIHAAPGIQLDMVKVAGHEIPRDAWNTACDSGLLDVFDQEVRHSLRKSPEILDNYAGTAVEEHIVSGLKGFNLVED